MPEELSPFDPPPEQTVPQTGAPRPTRTHEPIPLPLPPVDQTQGYSPPEPSVSADANPTATMAAPQAYDPSAVVKAATKPSGNWYVPSAPSQSVTDLGGRYAIVRAHARGGMGQVSVARDQELDRDVALKEIQPKYAREPATLARFILEAQVTGRLEHPGIVPVYGRGAYPDGRPYYAMRFVTGKSFQQAIEEFHSSDATQRDPRERSLALRALLRRFVDVCYTIGYAHSRGILHRDIKPGNVMLGAFGETLVVDWGLAKEMKSGQTSIPLPPPEPSLPPEAAIEEDETREGFTFYGQAMGTPAFMSPEQAAGKWDITGVASDVYSLGAMLYSILTGSAPYSGPTREVLTKVQRGEYRPPVELKTNVPKPLDAIVRKAMATRIENRYRTAMELAADLDHWLADEPVSCYVEPWPVRLARWARRHRTAVTTGAALVLTATAALTIGLIAVNREKVKTERAYKIASDSREKTREALFALTDEAVGDILAASNELTPAQRKFLDQLIGQFEQFVREEPDTTESKLFIAGAQYRVGLLQARLGQFDKAEASYKAAMALLIDPPADAGDDWMRTRGETQLYSGIMYLKQGRPEATADLTAARETFRNLVQQNPKPDFRYRLAQCEDRLGTAAIVARKPDEAAAGFHSALALREALAAEFPANDDYQFRVAQSLRQLAFVEPKPDVIRPRVVRAETILRSLVDKNPTSAPYLSMLADTQNQLAVLAETSAAAGGDTPAFGYAREAVRTWGRLVALFPGDPTYRRQQASANITLAAVAHAGKKPRDSLAAINAAIALLQDVDRDLPNDRLTLPLFAQALTTKAGMLRERGDVASLTDARTAATEAVTIAERAVAVESSGPNHALAVRAAVERAQADLADAKLGPARSILDTSWKHVQAAAQAGHSESIRSYARTLGDWILSSKSDAEAVNQARTIAALPLAKGAAKFEAGCFLARQAKLTFDAAATEPDRIKPVEAMLGEAFGMLKLAVAEGFDRISEIESDADLTPLRAAVEVQQWIAELKTKRP